MGADKVKPMVVLVHGAWADGSSWSPVAQRLQRDGYTVAALPNPLRGVAGDAAYLASTLKTLAAPILLVGHSYGGFVITNAATESPGVKGLVYVDAFIPDTGETVLQLAGAVPGSDLGGDPSTVFDFVPYPQAPEGDFDLYVKPELFVRAFANSLPGETAATLAATQRPVPLSALSEACGAPAWKKIPSWAIIGTADRVIPLDGQRFMARRAGAQSVEINTPHLSMLADPDGVAEHILTAAHSLDLMGASIP